MIRKIVLFISLLLSPMFGNSQTLVNGIYYTRNTNTKKAIVTNGSTKYKGSIKIPETMTYLGVTYSVTEIGQNAFYGCTNLTSVTIPNSVTKIGDGAFEFCSDLTEVAIGNNVKTIGYAAFDECSSLTSLSLPNSVTSIGGCAFIHCSGLISITIPKNVTQIGSRAFEYCSALTDVYCCAGNVPTTSSEAFGNTNITNATLHVPTESLSAYQASEPWSEFGTFVGLKDDEIVAEGVVINENHFPDATFRNWLLSQSYGSDGILTDTEIANVVSINVYAKGIQNLKGIEYFTALTGLYCAQNPLTSIDVSKNASLSVLSCFACNLTSLDVSNNIALTTLTCGNNRLSSIDVSKNPNLRILYCKENLLTALDVSNNAALTSLLCQGNQINSIDVLGHSRLESFDCSDNQLKSLDLSGCTALTRLTCSKNQIIGKAMNTLVSSLPEVSNGILNVIYEGVGEDNIMTISQVTEAKAKGWTPQCYQEVSGAWSEYAGSENYIDIDETNFPDTNFRNWILSQEYGRDGMLTDSEISQIFLVGVTARDIQTLKGIEYFTALKTLSCSNNKLVYLDLSQNTSLEVLYCSSNKLTSLNVSECKLLKRLDCYSNQLKSLDVSKNIALTLFNCWGNQLISLDVSENTELSELYCHFNQLTSLDLSKNTKLATLYCNNNEITSLDVSKNVALVNLYCYWNNIVSIDVSGCKSLTTLQCNTNQLASLDVSKNTTLISLSCYSNKICNENMDALVTNLPTTREGYLYVINHENEGNIMTTMQVEAAKAKGWIPYYAVRDDDWEEYAGKEPEPLAKCATPTIDFADGKLAFSCDTEGVDYHYEYSMSGNGVGNEATVAQIITVRVYATKDGYEDSDIATKDIDVSGTSGIRGDVNLDGEVGMPDVMFIVNYLLNGMFPDEE